MDPYKGLNYGSGLKYGLRIQIKDLNNGPGSKIWIMDTDDGSWLRIYIKDPDYGLINGSGLRIRLVKNRMHERTIFTIFNNNNNNNIITMINPFNEGIGQYDPK